MDALIQSVIFQSVCLGMLVNIVATLFLIWLQFRHSTAGYRVKMVKDATADITAPNANTSMLRDKYRYSLGVIIDDLHQSFKGGFKENGSWPPLIHNGDMCDRSDESSQNTGITKDRWDKFNRYIRPVIEDINAYSFIGMFPLTFQLRRLWALTKLCNCLEDVVGELDAAFEHKLVCLKNNRIYPANKENPDNPELQSLKHAYRELYKAWCNWYGDVSEEKDFIEAHYH